MSESDAVRVSRLLFEAREVVSMYADVVGAALRPDPWLRSLVERIDDYRAERGWSADGFGGES